MHHRVSLVLVALLVSSAVNAASLQPQVPPAERAVYADMLKTNRSAAQQYLDTRNYLSLSRQVVANPSFALDLMPQPDTYRPEYVTSAEQKIVDEAMKLNIAAMLSRKR
jgi:hypothetical protein